jgi:outer membrane cobalamin receptor
LKIHSPFTTPYQLKNHCLQSIAAATSIAILSSHAKAQDVEVFQITGSHINATDLSEGIPNITLTSKEIQALAANSFADVLRGLPGVDISQQGGLSGLTFLSIRGGDPNFVTVLIDGVKVNDPTNSRGGAFDLGTLDPSIIEKVDVFYGSFSTVYGSDALAGVLSIQTKQTEGESTIAVSAKTASHGAKGASVHIGLPISDIANFNLSASWQDGDNSTFGDAFARKELISTIKSNQDAETQWHISGFYAQGEGQYFPEDSGGDRLAVISTPETRDYNQTNIAARIRHPFTDKLNVTVDGSSSTRKEQLSSPGIAQGILDSVPAIDSDTDYQRTDISGTVNYQFSEQVSSAVGVTFTDEDGGMQSVIDFGVLIPADYRLDRQTNSAFAEVAIKPSQTSSIIAGIRHDKTDMLNVSTKRILANLQLHQNTKLSAQYSEGFKLPSFFALGHPLVGNTDLQPERSKNMELSVDQLAIQKTLSTRFSIYQNTYTDLVDFDPEAFTNVNRSKVRVRGAEISSSYDPSSNLNLMAQISYTNINTFEPDLNLRRRPNYKGSIKARYQVIPALSLTARYTINDGYFDSSVPTGAIELDGFNQLDVSAHLQTEGNLAWRLHINNVLDSEHEEAVGFSNAGPNITARVSTQF